MSLLTETQTAFLAEFLGIAHTPKASDGRAAGAAAAPALGDEELPEQGNFLTKRVGAIKDMGQQAVATAKKAAKVVGTAINDQVMKQAEGDLAESLKRLDKEIQRVKDAGLDATPYAAQANTLRASHAEALKRPDLVSRYQAVTECRDRARAAADQAAVDVARLKASAVEGISAAVRSLRDGAKVQIDKVPKDHADKAGLAKSLAALDQEIAAAEKLEDRAARGRKVKEINASAQKLFDRAVAASQDKSTVEAVYGKALQERYGFNINNPAGMPNTHLDQVYKMFDRVPEADVVQGRMQTLNYQPFAMESDGKGGKKKVKNTGASYGGARINMGDYGAEDWPYVDPKDPSGKTKVPANGFSISVLHELGHSVDERFGVMDANQAKSNAGGWRRETLQSTAKAFAGQFKAGDGSRMRKPLSDGDLQKATESALGGAVTRPDGLSDADWTLLEAYLNLCATRGDPDANWPWASPHDINGRSYHEAYAYGGGVWWSYETAQRAKAVTVRDYQWRAPGEWFAELYAFSFYQQKPPPSAVEPAVAAYMFGGKAAEAAPAKQK